MQQQQLCSRDMHYSASCNQNWRAYARYSSGTCSRTVTVPINCSNPNGSCNGCWLNHQGWVFPRWRWWRSDSLSDEFPISQVLSRTAGIKFQFFPFSIFVQPNKMRLSFYYLQGPCHTISKNWKMDTAFLVFIFPPKIHETSNSENRTVCSSVGDKISAASYIIDDDHHLCRLQTHHHHHHVQCSLADDDHHYPRMMQSWWWWWS